MDSIMRASALAGKASRTYLAIPKRAASIVDARLFEDRGIGLFTYDQRNVEEALPARYFEINAPLPHNSENPAAAELEGEISELRSQFETLEKVVRELREELSSVKDNRLPERLVESFATTSVVPEIPVVNNLPTFFSGNPWIEILSRRGREEAAIAG